MDTSPIKSGSKCGRSDFSIERILAGRKEESVEAPEWLCCTRYRPPRLPRGTSVCRARRAGRHARVPFTAAQAAALEDAYARAPYLAPPALKALAAALQLRDDRIKIWFQNRRARERREKSTIISPPQAITLAPTTLPSGFPSSAWIPRANFTFSRNTHAFYSQRFVGPRNGEASEDQTNNFNALSTEVYNTVPLRSNAETFDNNQSNTGAGFVSKDDENRPGTPLDIETVED